MTDQERLEEVAASFLRDLGFELRERAVQAHRQSLTPGATTFDSGRALAYYEVVDHIATQARVREIDPAALGFENFDPTRDLLNPGPLT